jgi:hypothetical protein
MNGRMTGREAIVPATDELAELAVPGLPGPLDGPIGQPPAPHLG